MDMVVMRRTRSVGIMAAAGMQMDAGIRKITVAGRTTEEAGMTGEIPADIPLVMLSACF